LEHFVPQNKRVLIANRGEIAIRIARAARGLGMESVSVYAAVDQLALHTRVTTEAKLIGQPGDTVAAYLDIEALVQAAKDTGCDCVHPGYGFLSENAEFALRCAEEGLTFVGPSAKVLSLFGDKVQARELALSLDIPIVAGSENQLLSGKDAIIVARKIGYPIMLKAAAGGGGRGMRAVEGEDEMLDAFERCSSEAAAAFGNGAMLSRS
jgi:pyruvate carboxylase